MGGATVTLTGLDIGQVRRLAARFASIGVTVWLDGPILYKVQVAGLSQVGDIMAVYECLEPKDDES